MKKFLLLLLTLCINSGAMEESQSACSESNADEWQQLLDIFLPKGIEVAKSEDITQNADTQHECEPQPYSDNLWDLLPGEIKLQIFTCIPKLGHYDAVKNLILVNHECMGLVTSHEFLRTFAYEIVKQNPEKALDIYAWAMEHQKRSLAKYLFSAYFAYYINPEKNYLSKEWARIFMIITMIEHNVKAARNIFCSAAAQGNEALVRLFVDVCSQTMYYTLASTSDQSERAKALSIFCHETGLTIWPAGRKNVAPCECNPTPLYRAIENHHKEIVRILSSASASIRYAYIRCAENIDEDLDHTAFNQAVFENDKDILQILASSQKYWLELGREFNEIMQRCLKNAVCSGRIEIVKLLLEFDFDNVRVNDYLIMHSGEQMTSLMIAAHQGQSDMVHHLISHGADVNMRSKNGVKEETAAMLAERNGHKRIAAFLRSHESSCLIS